MKIRIRFSKYGVLRFIGHLDVMRYFQKAMRRADINIQYSAGFSPHQIMSFASPLGVGLTSEGEYMDIEVGVSDSSEESMRRLNAVMAEGIDVLSYRLLPDSAHNAMSSVAGADYTVSFREGMCPVSDDEPWQRKLIEFYSQDQILITKKTKKSEREVDLKPHIHQLLIGRNDSVHLRLTAGSVENIKPEIVMEAFFRYLGQEMKDYALLTQRRDLLANVGSEEKPKFVSLDSFGSDIK